MTKYSVVELFKHFLAGGTAGNTSGEWHIRGDALWYAQMRIALHRKGDMYISDRGIEDLRQPQKRDVYNLIDAMPNAIRTGYTSFEPDAIRRVYENAKDDAQRYANATGDWERGKLARGEKNSKLIEEHFEEWFGRPLAPVLEWR